MASLIGWLKTDGARKTDGTVIASGRAYFYVPGTTTQIAVYGNADKTQTLSQPVTLNAAGQAEVYVDSIVKMVIEDSVGATIHTAERVGAAAEVVEVTSPSFTGTRPDGTTGAGGRVSSGTIYDRAVESLGGTDWEVVVATGAIARKVKSAFGDRGISVAEFGALGNDAYNNTAAFAAAIAFIKSRSPSGGKLIVPAGTYRVDDLIATIDFNGLVLEGDGINATVIKSTVTNRNLFTISAGFNFVMRDLQFTASSASSSYAVQSAGDLVSMERLKITNFAEGVRLNSTAFMSILKECVITSPNAAGICVHIKDAGTKFARMVSCYFDGTDTVEGIGVQIADASGDIVMDDCNFGAELATGLKVTNGFTGDYIALNNCDLSQPATSISVAATGFIDLRIKNSKTGTSAISDSSIHEKASGALLALTPGRTYFKVTGNTQTDLIDKRGWVVGMEPFTLHFVSNPVVRHNQAAAGNGLPILLAGAANFNSGADDTLTLVFDGSFFREVARTVI